MTFRVPKATKIGPMCFLMLIIDALTDNPRRWKHIDDSTVCIPVNTRSLSSLPLQAILDIDQAWTEASKMSANYAKTVVMQFCTSTTAVPFSPSHLPRSLLVPTPYK